MLKYEIFNTFLVEFRDDNIFKFLVFDFFFFQFGNELTQARLLESKIR